MRSLFATSVGGSWLWSCCIGFVFFGWIAVGQSVRVQNTRVGHVVVIVAGVVYHVVGVVAAYVYANITWATTNNSSNNNKIASEKHTTTSLTSV